VIDVIAVALGDPRWLTNVPVLLSAEQAFLDQDLDRLLDRAAADLPLLDKPELAIDLVGVIPGQNAGAQSLSDLM